jgi:hypothetical protein
MKRKIILQYLLLNGCLIDREGKKHTVIYNPSTKRTTTLPRHNEINTYTAKGICKD